MHSYLNAQLDLALKSHLANNIDLPRLTILGIGNELNGDDAAGVLIVRHLKQNIPSEERFQLIEGSIAPENYSKSIRNFNPDWIWLIDSADFGEKPGNVRLLDVESIDSVVSNTHRLPLSLLISILKMDQNPDIFLFGIQPKFIEPFTDTSSDVKISIKNTSEILSGWLKNTYNLKSR